jgi:hypothetical protein
MSDASTILLLYSPVTGPHEDSTTRKLLNKHLEEVMTNGYGKLTIHMHSLESWRSGIYRNFFFIANLQSTP